MFEVGFWELALIGVVALMVVGPERLPRLARTVGIYIGKTRRMVAQVKDDIEREVRADDLKQSLEEAKGLREAYESLDETRQGFNEAANSMSETRVAYESYGSKRQTEGDENTDPLTRTAPKTKIDAGPEAATVRPEGESADGLRAHEPPRVGSDDVVVSDRDNPSLESTGGAAESWSGNPARNTAGTSLDNTHGETSAENQEDSGSLADERRAES